MNRSACRGTPLIALERPAAAGEKGGTAEAFALWESFFFCDRNGAAEMKNGNRHSGIVWIVLLIGAAAVYLVLSGRPLFVRRLKKGEIIGILIMAAGSIAWIKTGIDRHSSRKKKPTGGHPSEILALLLTAIGASVVFLID